MLPPQIFIDFNETFKTFLLCTSLEKSSCLIYIYRSLFLQNILKIIVFLIFTQLLHLHFLKYWSQKLGKTVALSALNPTCT